MLIKGKRVFTFIALFSFLCVMLLTGCNGSDENITPTSTPDLSTEEVDPFEEPVELIWYAMGAAHNDTSMVMEELNKLLKERYNTTIRLNYTGWEDTENQYNLLLTSGEKVDLIYVNAAMYYRYAKSGAFLDITEKFPELMPKTYSFFDDAALQEIKIDDKLYGVPLSMHGYIPYGVLYRSDLAHEYGLPKITDLSTFEQYMDGIVENEDFFPYNGNPEYGFRHMFKSFYGFETIAGNDSSIIVVKSYDDIENIIAYPFTDEYIEWSRRMKDYADRGYWSKNALSAAIGAWDNIQVGTSAISIENPEGAAYLINSIAPSQPEYEFDYFCFTDLTGHAIPNPVMQDGFAVPKASVNPERSLRILEAIKTNQDLFDLYMYGIEGYHYDLDSDGKLIIPSASQDNAVVSGYDPGGGGWGMRVEDLVRTNAAQWSGFDSLMEQIKAKGVRNKFGAIALDYSSVQAEFAAVNQVVQQYGTPINVGLVSDVDAAIEEYRQKLTEAGIDKLVECVKDQMIAYYDANGIE